MREVSFHRSMQSTAPSRPCPHDPDGALFEILTNWKRAGVRSDVSQITSDAVKRKKKKHFTEKEERDENIFKYSVLL